MIEVTTIRGYAGGASRMVRSRPSLLGRLLFGAALVVVALLGLIVLLPFLVLGLLFAAALWLWVTVRVALFRAKQPNGAMDGRKNVRVRQRDDGGEVVEGDAPQT